jgi:predicted DNA-binding transcriptional regulator AlpA
MAEERFVTQREMAEIMGVSVKTVYRLTLAGMPSVVFLKRTRRYRPSVALAWCAARGGNTVSIRRTEQETAEPAGGELQASQPFDRPPVDGANPDDPDDDWAA